MTAIILGAAALIILIILGIFSEDRDDTYENLTDDDDLT